jgi:hypothetical protein
MVLRVSRKVLRDSHEAEDAFQATFLIFALNAAAIREQDPIAYVRGRAPVQLTDHELQTLHEHLDPGGGTLFADASWGSALFDASFRVLIAKLIPGNPLIPIPRDDDLLSGKVGFNLRDAEYTRAAGGGRGFPQLEGVRINGHCAIIYSKFDIGCVLEGRTDVDCKGYTPDSAARIAADIVIYAVLP